MHSKIRIKLTNLFSTEMDKLSCLNKKPLVLTRASYKKTCTGQTSKCLERNKCKLFRVLPHDYELFRHLSPHVNQSKLNYNNSNKDKNDH